MGADPAGVVATWLWQAGNDIAETVAFVSARGLREVCLAVPPDGVGQAVAALAAALRANGIAVSCLGGDPMWAVDHDAALNWAFRATTDAVFDGVHLDVEPWTLPGWPGDAGALMASYATLVEEMAEIAPLAVDLVPWLIDDHAETLTQVARQCVSMTMLAYRDSPAGILAVAAGMIRLCAVTGTTYRIGVETQRPSPEIPDNTTFGDDGLAEMAKALATVAQQLPDPLFDGFAIHHLRSWRAMST